MTSLIASLTAALLMSVSSSVASPGPGLGGPEVGGSLPPAASPLPAADTSDAIRLRVAPEGNEARYRVREQLASLDFPNDAVGRTSAIVGAVVVLPDGTVRREESRIIIDMTTLESDRDRRDNFLRRNTLETDRHPTLTLRPTAIRGLPNPIPRSGDHSFVLVADLVLKGETHPTTWDVQATFADGAVLGRATTIFTFERIGLEKPRVRSVLSVADDIRLEYDFRLVPEPEGPQ